MTFLRLSNSLITSGIIFTINELKSVQVLLLLLYAKQGDIRNTLHNWRHSIVCVGWKMTSGFPWNFRKWTYILFQFSEVCWPFHIGTQDDVSWKLFPITLSIDRNTQLDTLHVIRVNWGLENDPLVGTPVQVRVCMCVIFSNTLCKLAYHASSRVSLISLLQVSLIEIHKLNEWAMLVHKLVPSF